MLHIFGASCIMPARVRVSQIVVIPSCISLAGLVGVHSVQISELIEAARGQTVRGETVRGPGGRQRGRTQQARQRPRGK